MSQKTVISALIATIPDEEDATFVAQVGDRGRITSRAGTVEVDTEALTVAAIDLLNASIFPPDRLRTLEQTGSVQFYFAVPGVDGWFSAVAGSHQDDRWLEIRRRKTAGPPRVQPAAEAAAVPQAAQAAPATPATSGLDDDDLLDLAGLEFPSKSVDADSDALSFPEDLVGMPLVEKPLAGGLSESKDRSRAVVYPQRTRGARRIGIPVVACAALTLLGVYYFGASQTPAASSVPAVKPAAQPTTPPAARSTTQPAAQPTTPPAAQPTTPAAQPAVPAKTATASSPVQTVTSSAPAETVAPAEQPRSGFSVQVAAVETKDEADRIVTRFVTRGYSAYIARGAGAAATYYRVRIGAFPDRRAAEDVARQLEGVEGVKPWIAKEEGPIRR